MKVRSILALTLLMCLATFAAADSVTGTLQFGNNPNNYFDPANGYVPGGSDNSGSATIGIPGTFRFHDGANTDSAQFTGTQLIITDVVASGAANWTMTFFNPAFTSLALFSDNFVNGGTTGTLNNGLITITWAGTNGPGTYTAVYNVGETPEPGSLALLGSGLVGLGGAIRRKLIAR